MMKDYVIASAEHADEEFVARFWDERWRVREQQTGPCLNILRRREEYRFLLAVVPDLETRPLDILDCGCGLGEWTLLFKAQGHHAVGIDIAPETVRRLRDHHADSFRLCDFRHIEWPESSFDLIINWGGIEHFEEGPAAAITEAWRVLRPGGWYVATTPCHNPRLFLLDSLFGRSNGPGFPLHAYRFYQYRFTRSELEGYFQACGFREVRSRTIDGSQGMRRSLQHELGWLGKLLPAATREGLVARIGLVLRPVLGHLVICAGQKLGG